MKEDTDFDIYSETDKIEIISENVADGHTQFVTSDFDIDHGKR